jgi:hypothetical protein
MPLQSGQYTSGINTKDDCTDIYAHAKQPQSDCAYSARWDRNTFGPWELSWLRFLTEPLLVGSPPLWVEPSAQGENPLPNENFNATVALQEDKWRWWAYLASYYPSTLDRTWP